MKYPRINKNVIKSVNIPTLSGGVNLRDSLTLVADNQLTDAKNIWYNDGFLKTRPNLTTNQNMFFPVGRLSSNERVGEHKSHPEIVKNLDNEDAVLMSISRIYNDGINCKLNILFWWQSSKKSEYFSSIEVNVGYMLDFLTYFVVEKDGNLYCFLSNCEIYKSNYINEKQWYKVEMDSDEVYKPIVLTYCQTNGTVFKPDNIEGTLFEGYSLITSYYRVQYTHVNLSLLDWQNQEVKHPAIYYVPNEFKPKSKVILKYTNKDGQLYTHQVVLGDDVFAQTYESESPGDGYIIKVGLKYQISLVNETDKSLVWLTYNDFSFENNLEITAATENNMEREKLFKMTRCEWFGGAAAGINGGTRLFLTGNTVESEKALLLWSGLNEPLYFSENNSAYVGNKASKTTALAKQADKLIIFKENEVYYSCYARNDNLTASDFIEQSVIDYTTASVYFPLVLINSRIGCDCPDTIQLCRNRLVWAHSNGKVYTLTSENQYTERNIFEVSGMIERALKNEKAYLKKARSADFEGHYILFVKNRAYVMDYNKYGYQYVSSYSKSDDAESLIPWYYWEFPSFEMDIYGYSEPILFGVGNDRVCFSSYYNAETATMCGCVTGNLTLNNKNGEDILLRADESEEKYVENKYTIDSLIQTKFFDFGLPAHTKNISLVNISFGNNGGEEIKINYITENGVTDENYVYVDESEKNEYSPEYVHNKVLRPCLSFIKRIGIRIECAGNVTLDALSINYKILGGAR